MPDRGESLVTHPLVSVNIPTYNSAATLATTLDAVRAQTYAPVEVIVVDSYSSDNTVAIARNYDVRVVQIDGRLLKAREVGVRESHGDFVLLLDSDQILEQTAIERAVRLIQSESLDMLFFEEHSYRPRTWLQRLFELDRRFIHKSADMDVRTGVMLPRFFRRSILHEAIARIPVDDLVDVVAQDHAIIHWEVGQLSQRGALLPDAVYHVDPYDLWHAVRHFYNWGKEARKLDRNAVYKTRYQDMFNAKSRSRVFGLGRQSSLPSTLVLLIKGVPYFAGKWIG